VGVPRWAWAAVLVFVGTKMLLVDLWKVPTWLSLGVIATCLTVVVVASLRATRGDPAPRDGTAAESTVR
jgi:tellurite resistance protein TerC